MSAVAASWWHRVAMGLNPTPVAPAPPIDPARQYTWALVTRINDLATEAATLALTQGPLLPFEEYVRAIQEKFVDCERYDAEFDGLRDALAPERRALLVFLAMQMLGTQAHNEYYRTLARHSLHQQQQ